MRITMYLCNIHASVNYRCRTHIGSKHCVDRSNMLGGSGTILSNPRAIRLIAMLSLSVEMYGSVTDMLRLKVL